MNDFTDVTDKELYRCGIIVRFPITSSSDLVYFPTTGCVRQLPKALAAQHETWSEFKSIEQHTSSAMLEFPFSTSSDETLAGFRDLKSRGDLLAWSNLIDICSAAAETQVHSPITWISFPTHSRPFQLAHAVESYALNARTAGRNLRFFVADNSPSAEECDNSKRSLLREIDESTKVATFYSGCQERRIFADLLSQGGQIPPEVIEFALFGEAGAANFGANRNAILLQTRNSCALTVDDDTLCRIGSVVGGQTSGKKILFGSESDPTEFWFFPDRRAAAAYPSALDTDFVGAHENLLGRTLPSLFSEYHKRGQLNLNNMCPHILSYLMSGRGEVALTFNGYVGDCGAYSDFLVTTHPSSATRERLRQSQLVGQPSPREVVRQALGQTITHGVATLPAMFMGFDNRGCLPPFFPSYRGEDRIFGITLSRIRQDACFGHVPLALLHASSGERNYGTVSAFRVSDIVVAALASCTLNMSDQLPQERLQVLGRQLKFLGSVGGADFDDWMRCAVLARTSALARTYEAVIMRDGYYPKAWADDLARRIECLSAAATSPDLLLPLEFRVETCDRAAQNPMQRLLGKFGYLLEWWPTIVEKTNSLASAGNEIGRSLAL
jgi:hypothetical protein